MKTSKLTRRRFLQTAGGVGGALALSTLLGYGLMQSAEGEVPASGSPYSNPLAGFSPQSDSPILILLNKKSKNPFGLYLAEILCAEGLNCFQIADLTSLAHLHLDKFDLIILAEGIIDKAQLEIFEQYVGKGGQLVAMRPDAPLPNLFGVERVSSSFHEGYLKVVQDHPVGRGIATETLQFHGEADGYRLAGADVIAWLADDTGTVTQFPAVTLYKFGNGQAALWAFDLAQSVAYTRQGNPAWANQQREWDGLRAINMFFHENEQWVDLDHLMIPQADEQQRLLVNLLTLMSAEKRPLPRLWYFPNKADSVLVPTSDWHMVSQETVEEYLDIIEARNGHISFYYTPVPGNDYRRAIKKAMLSTIDLPLIKSLLNNNPFDAPSPRQVANFRARGHEFGLHPYVGEYSIEPGLEAGWRRYWQEFTGLGYGPVPPTVRTHRILWTGWVETARVQAAYGMRMNLDYYHWGPPLQRKNGEWAFGYLTGSGLPMKFIDTQGRILDIYQQLTELADDHMLDISFWSGVANLNVDEAVEVSKTILRNSVERAPSAIVAQFHFDPFAHGGEDKEKEKRFMIGTLDAAASYGMPILSAEQWLHFTEVRHDANLEAIRWHSENQTLTFKLVAQEAPDVVLTIMIPLQYYGIHLAQLEIDGKIQKYDQRTVGGVDYGEVSIQAASYQVVARYQ